MIEDELTDATLRSSFATKHETNHLGDYKQGLKRMVLCHAAGRSACGGKSLVFLQNTTGFVKFGSSGTLISNLTKSLLVLSPCLRGKLAKALSRVFLFQQRVTIWLQKI